MAEPTRVIDLKNQIEKYYKIDSDGTVWSIAYNWRGHGRRSITQNISNDGYLTVRLSISGRRINIPTHRLVALFHLPPRPSERHQIRHLDGNRLNPRAINLRWGTPAENAHDRDLHGNTARGERNGSSRLTEGIVREIKNTTTPARRLATKLSINPSTIWLIREGKIWAHL